MGLMLDVSMNSTRRSRHHARKDNVPKVGMEEDRGCEKPSGQFSHETPAPQCLPKVPEGGKIFLQVI
jgi:hypothetical protein